MHDMTRDHVRMEQVQAYTEAWWGAVQPTHVLYSGW